VVVADRAVTNFDGDLDDYRRMVAVVAGQRTPARDRAIPNATTAATGRARQKRKQERSGRR